MQVRRVATGQTADGKSVVVSDDRVDPITVGLLPGAEFHSIWGSDAPVRLPVDARRPPFRTWFPANGGFRFGFVTFPAAASPSPTELSLETALAELGEKLPGMLEVLEPDHPGMHTTNTVDFVVVVSGEVWLELDDGAQVRLDAGDCVVQNGTRHAWHNTSSEPCVVAVGLVGATRTP